MVPDAGYKGHKKGRLAGTDSIEEWRRFRYREAAGEKCTDQATQASSG